MCVINRAQTDRAAVGKIDVMECRCSENSRPYLPYERGLFCGRPNTRNERFSNRHSQDADSVAESKHYRENKNEARRFTERQESSRCAN